MSDLGRALRLHWGKAFFTFLLVLCATIALLLVLPRTYQSEAQLFVDVGRESVTLDPTVTTGQTLTLNQSREGEMDSILEVLESRGLAEKVVDGLGPEVVLSGPPGVGDEETEGVLSAISGRLAGLINLLEPTAPYSDREQAVQKLSKSTVITNSRQSNVVSVVCRARSPEHAQVLAEAIAQEYLQEHRRIHKTSGSYDFFVGQADLFAEELSQASSLLLEAKNRMGLASIDGRRSLLERRLEKVQTERQSAETALAANDARLLRLEQLIAELPAKVDAQQTAGMPNVAGDSMRQVLFQLQIEEKELLSKYTADHPNVVAVKKQVAEAKKILDQQASSRVYNTTERNPAVRELELDLLRQQTAGDAHRAELADLRIQNDQLVAELKELNQHEQEVVRLSRRVELAETNYRTYAEKLEQARIQQSLDQQQISNVSITQNATFVEKPYSPKKAIVLLSGLLLAGLSGLLVAVLAELRRPVLREARELEERLGVPVLATIPKVPRDRVLMN